MIIQAPSESSDANQSSLCRQMWALNANAVTWADKLLSALTKLSAQINAKFGMKSLMMIIGLPIIGNTAVIC